MTLSAQQIADGKTEIELKPFNLEMMMCFQDFIKYNTKLNHLNMERCGLIEPAIKFLAPLLRKSQALRCLHLCGNLGLSKNLIEWIRDRIHAKKSRGERVMEPMCNQKKYGRSNKNVRGSPVKRGLMKIHRAGSIEFQTPKQHQQQWKDIRAGLKLRNIVQQLGATEVKARHASGLDEMRCIRFL